MLKTKIVNILIIVIYNNLLIYMNKIYITYFNIFNKKMIL